MIEKLMRWLHEATRSKESYSDRDGFLSYAGEYHALIIGLGMGVYSLVTGDLVPMAALASVSLGVSGLGVLPQLSERAIADVSREPWYTIGGMLGSYLVGKIAQVGVGAIWSVL